MDNGVHIVRINSHLQLIISLFTQTGYTQKKSGLFYLFAKTQWH